MGERKIFQYRDYRSYLRDVYEDRRRRNPRFSLGVWARRLSLSGSSGLVMILKGNRNASTELVDRIIRELALGEREGEYFRLLASLDQLAGGPMEPEVRRKIEVWQSQATETAPALSEAGLRCLSHWLPVTLRAMVGVPGFREDVAWIRGRLHFPVEDAEIERALRDLESSGLLARAPDGRLGAPAQPVYFRKSEMPEEVMQRLNESVFELCRRATKELPPAEYVMIGASYSGSSEQLPSLRERAKDFIRTMQPGPDAKRERPFLVQIAIVPVARAQGGEND